MTFSKTSKDIREFIFHKIIKLIVKHSVKQLGHMGHKTNRYVVNKKNALITPDL